MNIVLFLIVSAAALLGFKASKLAWFSPAGIYTLFWTCYILLSLIFYRPTLGWTFSGLSWIMLSTLFVTVCNYAADPPVKHKCVCFGADTARLGQPLVVWNFRVRRAVALVLILTALGLFRTFYYAMLNGFGFSDFLGFGRISAMSAEMTARRYGGNGLNTNIVAQILLVAMYAAPFAGGYLAPKSRNFFVWLAGIASLLPAVLAMLVDTTKAGLIASVLFFVIGFMLSLLQKKHWKFRLRIRYVVLALVLVSLLAAVLLLMMRYRAGDGLGFDDAIQKFLSYACGGLEVFDQWFRFGERQTVPGFGVNTFLSIFDNLGLTGKEQGVYPFYPGLETNIYTGMRGVIEDFGSVFGLGFLGILIGFLGGKGMKAARRGARPVAGLTTLVFVYYTILYSFIISPWVFMSYFLAIPAAAIFLRLCWRRRAGTVQAVERAQAAETASFPHRRALGAFASVPNFVLRFRPAPACAATNGVRCFASVGAAVRAPVPAHSVRKDAALSKKGTTVSEERTASSNGLFARLRHRFKDSSFLKDLVVTVGGQLVVLLVTFGLNKLLSNKMSVENFGVFNLLKRASGVVTYVMLMAMAIAVPKFVAAAVELKEEKQQARYFFGSLIIVGAASVLTIAVFGIFAGGLSGFVMGEDGYSDYMLPLALYSFGLSMTTYVYSYYRAIGKYYRYNISQIFVQIAGFLIAILLFRDLKILLYAWAAFYLLYSAVVVVGAAVKFGRMGGRAAWKGMGRTMGELLAYGLPRVPGEFVLFSFTLIPLIIVTNKFGLEASAYFGAGITINTTGASLFSFVGIILLPAVSRSLANRQLGNINKKILLIGAVYLALSVLCIGFIELFPYFTMDVLYSPDYYAAIPITRILIVAVLPNAFYLLFRNPLDAISKFPYNTVCLVLSFGVMMGLMLAADSIEGCAAAFVVGYALLGILSALCWFFCIWRFKKKTSEGEKTRVKFTETELKGVYLVEPVVHGDSRGWFAETYNRGDFEAAGLRYDFVQDNQSFSAAQGTLRGLHFQKNPCAQAKLVRCTQGKILDVAVDLRRGSETYLKYVTAELSAENHRELLIPRGFAHGFVTLTPDVMVQYKVDALYSKDCDRGIRYDDPTIGVPWGTEHPVLSAKDTSSPMLSDSDADFSIRVLVTGAKGQLGSDVMKKLISVGYECLGVDADDCDLTDAEAVNRLFDAYRPDAVIHCAAYTAVDRAESEPEICRAVNVTASEHVAEACAAVGAKLVYLSTDYVYDGKGDRPIPTTAKTKPVSVYGKTKLDGENVCKKHLKRLFVVRTSWVFGKNGNNFVKTMLRLAREGKPIRVVDDQIGSPTYTRDLADFLFYLMNSTAYGTYHCSNEGYCSWHEFACEILRQANMEASVEAIPTEAYASAAKRPKNSRLDKTCLTECGFGTMPTWQDALARCLGEIEGEQKQ